MERRRDARVHIPECEWLRVGIDTKRRLGREIEGLPARTRQLTRTGRAQLVDPPGTAEATMVEWPRRIRGVRTERKNETSRPLLVRAGQDSHETCWQLDDGDAGLDAVGGGGKGWHTYVVVSDESPQCSAQEVISLKRGQDG